MNYFHNYQQPCGMKVNLEDHIAESCSYANKRVPLLQIHPDILKVVKVLNNKLPGKEWQIYLIGKDTPKGVFVDDYYIPKQEVTCGTVENTERKTVKQLREMNIKAILHSHGSMPVFFSHTDIEGTMFSGVCPFYGVCNNQGEFKWAVTLKLPCGMFHSVEVPSSNIIYTSCPIDEEHETKPEKITGIGNIKRASATVPYGYHYNQKGGLK